MNKKVNVMGFLIDSLTMEQTIDEIKKVIKERKVCQHAVVNAGKMVAGLENEGLRNILNECDIVNADGQSVVWAARFLGVNIPERVTGIDLMDRLVNEASTEGYRIYFFGAKEEVVKRVVEIYKTKYPTLQVAGYRNGYFNEDDNEDIVDEMKKSNADILFIAFSSPKKEYWLKKYINQINIPFCMGVGGSYDVVAGVTKRAPLWMQRMGLEWFYRFIQEPRRMWRRYIVGNFKFMVSVLKNKLGGIYD